MLIKLAWRNIWRNKRRTYITVASIFFAVILSTLMMSLKEGVYSNMINSMIGSYMGFGQIHAKGYWEEKTLDYSFELSDELSNKINNTKGISGYMERVESFAMAASSEITKVTMVVGVDVEKEKKFNALSERIAEGAYLEPDDKSVMIGFGLAQHLKIKVGDTLVLLGQGYQGVTAAGKYPVKALVKFGSPELSKQVVFLPIKEARWFYGMDKQLNNLILQFDNPDNSKQIISSLANDLDSEYEIMHWEELAPELKNMIETDKVEGYVFMFILYLVISFGIFGTSLMMLAERQHEFGVMVAIGMKRSKLAIVVWLEVLMISLFGAFVGMFGAFPISYYFHVNPIQLSDDLKKMTEEYGLEAVIQSSIDPAVFIQQAIVIAIIACVIGLYPLLKILRLSAIKSMRS